MRAILPSIFPVTYEAPCCFDLFFNARLIFRADAERASREPSAASQAVSNAIIAPAMAWAPSGLAAFTTNAVAAPAERPSMKRVGFFIIMFPLVGV